MNIETLTLGALSTNCYLIYDTDSLEGIVVDPSDEAVFIAEILQRLKIKLSAIIATHGHFDHVLGAGELQLITNAPFLIHERDLFLLRDMNKSASYWLKSPSKKPLPQLISHVKKNDIIALGKNKLKIIETPGHTPGSICIYSKSGFLCTGDTLFCHAVGRTDLSYSDPKKLSRSLNTLFQLPENTIVYPGHGEITILGQEKGI